MLVVCVAWLRAELEVWQWQWQWQLPPAVVTSHPIGYMTILRGEAVAANLQQVWSQTWHRPL